MSLTLPDLLRVFTRIGLLSFGGPATQIAVMHGRALNGSRNCLNRSTLRVRWQTK